MGEECTKEAQDKVQNLPAQRVSLLHAVLRLQLSIFLFLLYF